MHARLAQSIADSQRPGADGRTERPVVARSDAVASFSDLLQPSDTVARLGFSYGRVASIGTALPERGIEASRASDRTDKDVSRRRSEPDRDDAGPRSDEKWSVRDASAPASSVGSEQEPVASDPPTEAPAEDPESERAHSSLDEPDTKSADPGGMPVVPLGILTFPNGTSPASDPGLGPDAASADTPVPLDPVGPVPDLADAARGQESVDSAPTRLSVRSAGEGVSSKPSSLLVPQAVLADAGEMAATPGVANTPPAATPIGAGVVGPELAGSATQSPSPPGSAQTLRASTAQAPAEPAAPSSPVAIAGAAGGGVTGDDDFAGAEQGFSSGAGTHAPLAMRATGADRLLASKPLAAQIAPHVAKAAKAGITRIEVALEPASLGRVEVRLDFGRDGTITALFVAESREALDALRADARALERTLSEAGLKTDSGSLGFSLREQGAGADGRFSGTFARSNGPSGFSAESAPNPGSGSAPESPMPSSGERRLDIRA